CALTCVAIAGVVRELRRLRCGGEAECSGRSRCAADDPILVRLLTASVVGARPRRALARTLFVPEEIESIAGGRLECETETQRSPVAGGARLTREVGDVDELRRVARILIRVHSRHGLPAAFRA